MVVRPGYKQTEAGSIPDDWELRTLGDISAFITKGATPTTYGFDWAEDGILFLRSECVSEHGLDLAQSMFISPAAHAALKRGEVHSGDLLVTITGNVGRVVLLHEEFGFGNINQHIARVRPCDPAVDAMYLFQFLSQPRVRKYYALITTGQAYPQISLRQVRDTEIPFPPLPEQRAIAAALSDVDALISGLDKLIAKKRDIKQGAMQQLLTGRIRLPGFSGEWEVRKLGDIGSFRKGRNIPKSQLTAQGEPCVLYGEIYTRYDCVVPELMSYIPREVAEQATPVQSGDILFAGSGETAEEIGKCFAYVGTARAYAGGDLIILSPMEADSTFLGYQLNSPSICKQKEKLGQGSSVVHIYVGGLATIEVPLPTPPEQRAIATILSDMDAEIAALERRRDKTRVIKQGMMQELLTGRRRLI